MPSNRRVVGTCVCHVCNGVRSRLNKIFAVLHTYGWLLDTYIVVGIQDFFEDSVWTKLPLKWRDILEDSTPQELGNWALGIKSSTRVWPLSLLALQKTIVTLRINREYETTETLKCCGLREEKSDGAKNDVNVSSSAKKRKLVTEEHQNLFTKSVKMKKRHEIENIAETTSECASFAKCECIVDIGAGMGHLARTLAYNYGLCVVCLEQNESLSQQARVCDERLFTMLQKRMPQVIERNPCHISARITELDVQNEELVKNLKNEFINKFGLSEKKSEFGLIGLHCCGDLAATLLRLYSEQEEARFICIVGCCYMKITCGTKETTSFGYPMSKYVSLAENHELSYAALEVACHAIENYCDKLREGNYEDLLVHAYRATLETILIQKNGKSIRRSHLKNVKLKNNMTFERYCMTAVESLEEENRPGPTDLTTEEVSKCLRRWREVVAFGTLRFMLAPLVETAVLLDRFLYLSENSLVPSLKPIFDPRLSPRNIVLTSCK